VFLKKQTLGKIRSAIKPSSKTENTKKELKKAMRNNLQFCNCSLDKIYLYQV